MPALDILLIALVVIVLSGFRSPRNTNAASYSDWDATSP